MKRKTSLLPCTALRATRLAGCRFLILAMASLGAPGQARELQFDTNRSGSIGEAGERNPSVSAGAFSVQTTDGEVKEDQLKQLLVGKTLYLRGGYQENSLEFDESGKLIGHSSKGSFTLSQIQINKIQLSRHKLTLEGDRYALHFLGAAPYEDPTKATDRVKITPKKKLVHICFDREQVEKSKKATAKHHREDNRPATPDPASSPLQVNSASDSGPLKPVSQTHASQLLLNALDSVFSSGIDERMIAAMPNFWRLYFEAAAQKTDYAPTDPLVFHQNAVDKKAKLISAIDPQSNEFAQTNGVAGIALYHTIVASDGKVQEVVAGRPIGFGLDENAEATIRKATFQPAMKDGKNVAVILDLVVSFRIYSRRTSERDMQPALGTKAGSFRALPGPYSAQALEQQAAQSSQPAAQNRPGETGASTAQPPSTPR